MSHYIEWIRIALQLNTFMIDKNEFYLSNTIDNVLQYVLSVAVSDI